MPEYYEFEVSLLHIKPRIWRRFLLRESASFAELNEAIQDALGWRYGHLWIFREPGRGGAPIAGLPGDDDWEERTPDAKRVKLSGYFSTAGARCVYEYDFGDGWEHEVKMKKGVTDAAKFKRRLLAGSRACPPEDCGGGPGYYQMVEFVQRRDDPDGEDPEELAEWLGDWDPERFDLEATRKAFDR